MAYGVYLFRFRGFFAVTINIVQDYRLLKREISGFAETVDEVMTLAINPYVRLNSEK